MDSFRRSDGTTAIRATFERVCADPEGGGGESGELSQPLNRGDLRRPPSFESGVASHPHLHTLAGQQQHEVGASTSTLADPITSIGGSPANNNARIAKHRTIMLIIHSDFVTQMFRLQILIPKRPVQYKQTGFPSPLSTLMNTMGTFIRIGTVTKIAKIIAKAVKMATTMISSTGAILATYQSFHKRPAGRSVENP